MQRREYFTVQDYLRAIDSVTEDDVTGVLARYPLSINTTLAIGPLKQMTAPRKVSPVGATWRRDSNARRIRHNGAGPSRIENGRKMLYNPALSFAFWRPY